MTTPPVASTASNPTGSSSGSESDSPPVALITGASSGIGRAVAELLAEAGYALALVGRRAEPLEATGATLGVPWLALPADVGDPGKASAIVDRAVERFGRLDAVINNAGLATLLPIDKHDAAGIERSFRVNAIGPAITIARAWPTFARQRRGCVVNVSTMGTSDPFPGFFGYAASKASVNLMAQSCAKEGVRLGVRAFAVAPGAVETPMLRSLFNEKAIPPTACLAPHDVARVVVDCVLGRRDDENGRTIFVPNPGRS